MSLGRGELAELCDLARRAGAAVMAIYAGDPGVREKDNRSPVTDADLAADVIIRAGLTGRWPDVAVVSEESPLPEGSAGASLFLVDPLDGTKEFLTRNGEFTVNIALVEAGRAVAGVVYAPALDEMFYGSTLAGAWKQTPSGASEISAVCYTADRPLRVMGSRSHGGPELDRWLKGLRVPHEFVAAGSSLKLCRVAEGAADIYPRFGPTSQWDTAAGQCVVELAGGAVAAIGGGAVTYGLDRPILNPHFAAAGDRRTLALLDSPIRELA